jgi:hypothetical protein
MRIGRAIVLPTILTLGIAGASLAGAAMPATAAQVSAVHVQAQGAVLVPWTYCHS